MKIVKVEWFDACSCETEPQKPITRTNVGFLISDEGDYVVLSKEIAGNKTCGFLTIPKVLIKNMVELYEYWQFKKEMEKNKNADE